MPKRLLFVLAAVAVAVAACKSGSSTPLPSSSPASPSPDPSISQALVSVTVGGTPAARIPVQISTPKNPTSPRPGRPFQIKKTGKKGGTTFRDLKPAGTYCWVAIITPSFKSSECAGWEIWQSNTIMLGN